MVEVLGNIKEVGIRGAEIFASHADESIRQRGAFRVALSGGSTPRAMFEALAHDPHLSKIQWDKIHVFWGDERCVPPEHHDSNYKMAHDILLRHTSAHLHRIKGELSPNDAVRSYEAEIKSVFQYEAIPDFDLIILGMGDDGHTASLFPDSSAIDEKERLIIPVTDHSPMRVTLTLPVINNARAVMFMMAGQGKAGVLKSILKQGNKERLPAGLVKPLSGELLWMVDVEASAEL